jgi:hypothetical protein
VATLAAEVAEPAVQTMAAPAKTAITRTKSTLNLSQIGKQQPQTDKPKEEVAEKLTIRNLSFDEVHVAWLQFAESRKTQVAEYNLLTHDFEVTGNVVKIHLANPVEEPLLAGLKADLVAFLKDKLNAPVVVEGALMQQQTRRIIYTNKEKFDHLAEKYPYLHELKDRLGLDADY